MKSDLVGRVVAQMGRVIESRSSTLVPLQWTSFLLLAFLLLFVVARASAWLEIGLFILTAIIVGLNGVAYVYFMTKNPDALRSERHVLSKYAIDKGLYGDSDAGMLEVPRFGGDFLLEGDIDSSALSSGSELTTKELR